METKEKKPAPKKDLEWRPADDADEKRQRHGSDTRVDQGERHGSERREPEEPHRQSEAV